MGSYSAYLKKGADGQPAFPPLLFEYTHPDSPETPASMNNFIQRNDFDANWKKEEEGVRWLVREFLRDNPNSRVISTTDLKQIVANPLGSDVSAGELQLAANDLLKGTEVPLTMPNVVFNGRMYYSLADMFQLLSAALAEVGRTGTRPASIKLANVYGPLEMSTLPGPSGEVTFEAVLHAAAGIADQLRDTSWKPMPSNAIPLMIDVGNIRVNAGEFLILMAQAYSNPVPATKLKVTPRSMFSQAGGTYPHHSDASDIGNVWTARPALISAHEIRLIPAPPAPPAPPVRPATR